MARPCSKVRFMFGCAALVSCLLAAASLEARTWRSTPLWTRAAALSALLYLLVHARMNRASGGLPFNYRYPLEPLVLATPLLSVAIDRWRQSSERRQLLVFAAVAAGFVLQALYAFTLVCEPFDADNVICELGRF